jgi:CheY-like chemotaxis protein
MFSVLVIENEPHIRLLVSHLLKEQGYAVAEANNGQEALLVLDASPRFDLIITNIQMPVITGFHLLKELDRFFPKIPLLIMTGYYEKFAFHHREMEFAFLKKPFSRQQLLHAIRQFTSD